MTTRLSHFIAKLSTGSQNMQREENTQIKSKRLKNNLRGKLPGTH